MGLVWSDSPPRFSNRQVSGSSPLVGPDFRSLRISSLLPTVQPLYNLFFPPIASWRPLTQLPGTTYDSVSFVALLLPSLVLTPNTTFTLTAGAGLKDLAGNPLAATFSCSFTTGSLPDITPPTIVSTTPGCGTTGIALNATANITFSEPMDPSTINGSNITLLGCPCGTGNDLTGTNLGGTTLISGVYCFSGSASLTTPNLTLDAQGDSSAVFIIQIPGNLTTVGTPKVILANGAQAANVFWQVGGSVLVSGGSVLQGNVLCHGSITVGLSGSVTGRLLSETGIGDAPQQRGDTAELTRMRIGTDRQAEIFVSKQLWTAASASFWLS